MTDKNVVFSTCGSLEEARKIAQALVETRHAACVSIVPGVESVYRWQGRIETSSEFLLLIKTRRDLLPRLLDQLRELHSYEVPEAIALPIVAGLPDYLDWIGRETRAIEDEQLA